jgi:hypothetical protein
VKKTIKIDYGDYANLEVKGKTEITLEWELPALDKGAADYANDYIADELDKLTKELNSGRNEVRSWLQEQEEKVQKIRLKWQKKESSVTDKDREFLEDLEGLLPHQMKNLQDTQQLVYESELIAIEKQVIPHLIKKFGKAPPWNSWSNLKKVAKITAYAVVALSVGATAIVATILTFGVAAGPIIAAVGVGIGALSTAAAFTKKSIEVWNEGKDEARNLEAAANAYVEATKNFDEVLKRQALQLSAKQMRWFELQDKFEKCSATVGQLDKLRVQYGEALPPELNKNFKDAIGLCKALDLDLKALEKDIKEQQELLRTADSKKSFEAASKFADATSGGQPILNKIAEHTANLSLILNFMGQAVGA